MFDVQTYGEAHGIMGCLSCPQAHSRWTAQRNGTEMSLEQGALIYQVFLGQRCIREGVKMIILIIRENKENVRLSFMSLGGN